MGIEEVLIAFRSPWQSPYVERLIGSIRRECLGHLIVLNEDHLRRRLSQFFTYYHEARAHLSPERNSPIPRPVCPPAQGKISRLALPDAIFGMDRIGLMSYSCRANHANMLLSALRKIREEQ